MDALTINIPGFTIAYKRFGDPNLPPMLALHGWLDNANSFDLLAPYLEKHFHLIAIDFPGHGHSSHLPIGCNYHFIDGIFSTLQIIKGLGYQQVHLLSHSMGACLASLIAGVAPEKILSLVLLEGLGPFSNPDETCREQLANYFIESSAEIKLPPRPYASFELAVKARAKRGYLAVEHAEIICRRGLEEKQKAYYWRHDQRLLISSPLTLTEGQVLSCLKSISAKSCLIWADKGFAFDSQIMQKRAQTVKNLETYQLTGGHHIHMEDPSAVAACLAQFYGFPLSN